MQLLKLIALDKEDLSILSAHMQDAVIKAADLTWRASAQRFILVANRFVWEAAEGRSAKHYERRRAALHFNRVTGVRSRGFDRRDGDKVLSLLTINFVPGNDAPAGVVELIFSGEMAIELDVECVEAQLSDLGAAWETGFKPKHPLDDV
ncbi:DUF2948 family protein [Hoeflea sp. CAU 1731]